MIEATMNIRFLKLALMTLIAIKVNDAGVLAFQPATVRVLNARRTVPFDVNTHGSSCGRIQDRYGSASELHMTEPESGETETKSKRKRLKENIKKIVKYPKGKIQGKIRQIRSKISSDKSADILGREPSESSSEHHAVQNTLTNGESKGSTIPAINGDTKESDKAPPTASTRKKKVFEQEDAVRTTESESTTTSPADNTQQGHESVGAPAVERISATSPEPTTNTDDVCDQQINPVRSATSNSVDLSGKWELVVSEDFKTDYDKYLQTLGQPPLVRSVALSIIGMTTEETTQSDDGRELKIRGRNVRGNWERTLRASSEKNPLVHTVITADKETVESECWWEDNGSVHRSWLRGVGKYGGGDFESKRYLEDNGGTLVCESTFHPSDSNREKATVQWRFKRMDE